MISINELMGHSWKMSKAEPSDRILVGHENSEKDTFEKETTAEML